MLPREVSPASFCQTTQGMLPILGDFVFFMENVFIQCLPCVAWKAKHGEGGGIRMHPRRTSPPPVGYQACWLVDFFVKNTLLTELTKMWCSYEREQRNGNIASLAGQEKMILLKIQKNVGFLLSHIESIAAVVKVSQLSQQR